MSGKLKNDHKLKILRLKEEGYSYNQIKSKLREEDLLEITKESVYKFCKRYKIHGTLRSPPPNYDSRYVNPSLMWGSPMGV
jgi:tRNA(Ile)-lysidine synthase TilS/MesJ